MKLLTVASVLLFVACANVNPNHALSTPTWPEVFHAQLYYNRSGNVGTVDLYYDWPKARNLNIIRSQLDRFGTTWDVEWNNGTSYYFDSARKSCKTVTFQVGILRPDWLEGATFVGVETINNFECNVWTKADFIMYYEDADSGRPVRWDFLTTGAVMQVLSFEEGVQLPEQKWQAPVYCFREPSSPRAALRASAMKRATHDERFDAGLSSSFLDAPALDV